MSHRADARVLSPWRLLWPVDAALFSEIGRTAKVSECARTERMRLPVPKLLRFIASDPSNFVRIICIGTNVLNKHLRSEVLAASWRSWIVEHMHVRDLEMKVASHLQ